MQVNKCELFKQDFFCHEYQFRELTGFHRTRSPSDTLEQN